MTKNKEDIAIKRLKKQAFVFGVFFGITWLLELILGFTGILDKYFFAFKFSPITISIDIGMRIIGFVWLFFNSIRLKLNLLIWLFFILFSPVLAAFLISITDFSDEDDELIED